MRMNDSARLCGECVCKECTCKVYCRWCTDDGTSQIATESVYGLDRVWQETYSYFYYFGFGSC